MLTDKTYAENMALLAELYEKPLSETIMKVYYAILKDMQDDDFKQAIRRLLSERVYPTFPKPAEILELSNVVEVASVEVDEVEIKAKELIELVQGMNGTIYQDHLRTGIKFDVLLDGAKFPSVSVEDITILNQVKPYCSLKGLIAGINRYQTSKDALNAFKTAIKFSGGNKQIENPIQNLRIKR